MASENKAKRNSHEVTPEIVEREIIERLAWRMKLGWRLKPEIGDDGKPIIPEPDEDALVLDFFITHLNGRRIPPKGVSVKLDQDDPIVDRARVRARDILCGRII
jgi:hypothetical protein